MALKWWVSFFTAVWTPLYGVFVFEWVNDVLEVKNDDLFLTPDYFNVANIFA